MFIKQLTVHGFKSYRDETVFGPFSPHHNVIVGRNGSGKSNFFAAIRFVLHDAYTQLGQNERQALLHEGGAVHLSAYVEIVFDNLDGRFPTGKETTVIRRTVGLKKDEYSVDGKTSTKTDVMNLLQAAGFSKSNPYYIVPQGRVTALTNAKDEERLALLKEVAGTRTYEEHRQESMKILEETTGKREKINELLAFINERLKELEEERTELRQFQEKDKERKTLEYILQHRELVEVGDELETLEGQNSGMLSENNMSLAAFDDLQTQINVMEGQLVTLRESLERDESGLLTEEQQKSILMKEEERLNLELTSIKEKTGNCKREEEIISASLEKVNADISFKEDALASILPKLKLSREQQQDLQKSLLQVEGRRDVLMAKQGRSIQFRSASERDKWLGKEIESVEGTVQVHQKQLSNVKDELITAKVRVEDLSKEVADLSFKEGNLQDDLNSMDGEMYSKRQRRDQLTEQRKELWRAENKLETSIQGLREETSRSERDLQSACMERGVMQGLSAIKRLTSQLNLTGVYGPLYELFEVDNVFRLATETVAGSSLFHVVVEDEQVASDLLERLVKEKAGRVTFMPLRRLRPSPIPVIPSSDEAVPLIQQLKFDPRFSLAMQQVFGKAIVCQELAKGSSLARQYGVTAITLNGDRADKRGALSGGFNSTGNVSKLEVISKWKSTVTRLMEHERLLLEVKGKLAEIEPQITRILGDLQQMECQRDELRRGGSSALELRRRELSSLTELLGIKEKSCASLEPQIGVLRQQISSLQSEIGTPLTSKLSSDEQVELNSLNNQIENARQDLTKLSKLVNELASDAAVLESELEMSLRRRRHDLTVQLAAVSGVSLTRQVDLLEKELASTTMALDKISNTISTVNTQISGNRSDFLNIQSALEQARSQYDSVVRSSSAKNAGMEKYLSKRMGLVERKEVLQRKLRELAVAPDAHYEELRDRPAAFLLKKLHSAKDDLRHRFAHVNKKAQEQYNSFNEQGGALRERHAELEASAKAINDFILVLDRRKDEAIERTFQQVAKGFAQVFEKIVPAGRGELLMIRSMDNNVNNDDLESGNVMMDVDSIGNEMDFTGVGIRISFNSKTDEGLLMSQLSGGQKSLVALSLILAIQQCDPAPFYLFDEIDANLDAAYRSAVARIIGEMKASAQFVTTTFRPELLEDADAYLGVSFGGRVSRVETISREQALQFVEVDPKAQI